ncbi:MAG: hypothetical protein ACRDZ8_13305 [Acidimicrobiales bacterium]
MVAVGLVAAVAVPAFGVGVRATDDATPDVAAAAPHVGTDISWPQCSGALPASPDFGIVGANDGRPDTVNPCFVAQDRWASASGLVMFYMNTANPGVAASQAFAYGYSAAQYAYQYANRHVNAGPTHVWWLDVETANSWDGSTTANTLDIEGSLSFFANNKVPVGVYSTTYQWGVITGGARIPGILNWVAGAYGAADVGGYCSPAHSFSGGPVYMAQYTTVFDYDLLCPGMTLPQPKGPPPNLLATLLQSLALFLKTL